MILFYRHLFLCIEQQALDVKTYRNGFVDVFYQLYLQLDLHLISISHRFSAPNAVIVKYQVLLVQHCQILN